MAEEVEKQDSCLVPDTPSQPSPTRQRMTLDDSSPPVQLEANDQAFDAINQSSQSHRSQCVDFDLNLTPDEVDDLNIKSSTPLPSTKKRKKKKVYWPKIYDENKIISKKTTCKSNANTNKSKVNTPKPSTPKQRKSYVRKRPSCTGQLFPHDSASLPSLKKASKVEEDEFDNPPSRNESGIKFNSLETYQRIRLAGSCLIECREIGVNFPRNCKKKRKNKERFRLEKLLAPFKKKKRSKSLIRKKRCWLVLDREEFKVVISKALRSLIKRIKSSKKKKRDQKIEANNQIVVYNEEHQMVPYVELSKGYKGEVELDDETLRVWNFLVDGRAHEDYDREKQRYWEEQRKHMYLGRIAIFMNRINNTLGDRRFLPWKGSVLDSVVGVYLTQNVSDFLSSEAFMNLAAKFPAKTTSHGSKTIKDLATFNTHGPKIDEEIEYNKVEEVEVAENAKDSSEVDNKGTENNTMPDKISAKKKLAEEEKDKIKKQKEQHWDMLRKMYTKSTRHSDHEDSVDWEAVRCAHVSEFAKIIKCRGQHNIIAGKIQRLLNHLKNSYGNLDLEWLRYAPPKDVKDYLLSIYGLGLKSVECIRLLALQHTAFPVDVNVGRIAVRLGWVPLKPLPESIQIHELVKFPKEEDVQKYLWPRICHLDRLTLYELHYQMITFGKVFCRKGMPNCNACPMREEGCKYYESKLTSKKLALPGITSDTSPGDNKIVAQPTDVANSLPLIWVVNNSLFTKQKASYECEPIIEFPASPEPESAGSDEIELYNEEDFYKDDESDDEILIPAFRSGEYLSETHNYSFYDYESDMNMSRDLVTLPTDVANTPAPRFKTEKRTRTERLVYILHDKHPLLEKCAPRLPDDRSPYLLVVYAKGELKGSCESTENNSQEEDYNQTVPCTLLIPLRTAMGGRFPLNGTYFQINEVFADYDSLKHPINVPRGWLCNLDKCFVYFGTGISTIVKDMTTEQIKKFFEKDYVCVKAIEAKTGFPRPLSYTLHRRKGQVIEE